MLVIGKTEAAARQLTVRLGSGRNIGELTVDGFMEQVFRRYLHELPQ